MLENNLPKLANTSTNESATAKTGSSLVEEVVVKDVGRRLLVAVSFVAALTSPLFELLVLLLVPELFGVDGKDVEA